MTKDNPTPTNGGSEEASSHERIVASYRRKFNDCVSQLGLIKDWGKKACSDPTEVESVAFFKGMMKHLETTFNKFEELWQDFEALQDDGAKDVPSPTDVDVRKTARNLYFTANKYQQLLEMHSMNTTGANSSASNESKIARSLPKLNLPTFDGKHADWPSYRDSFVSLVDSDPSMAEVSKLNYLRSSLSGPAFSLISHLTITATNYQLAWRKVKETYDNKRLLAATYLDQILAAKSPSGRATPETLKAFLSSVGDSVAGLKLLQINDESEYILFYLAVRALDPGTRELFETAHKDTEFPTVDQLVKFVRERSTSLMLASTGSSAASTSQPAKLPKPTKPPQPKNFPKTLLTQDQKTAGKKNSTKQKSQGKDDKATTSSPDSQPKHLPCFVCKNASSHHLLSCEKFHLASVDERWKLLAGWKGCINCLNSNHAVEGCASTWSCRFCPDRHHSSLHRSRHSLPSNTTNSLNATTQEEGQIILGTALAEFLDARGEFQTVRVVIDSGSQNSFITQKCLNRLGLTMQHLRKRISGIGQTPFEGTKGKTSCIIRPRNQHALQLRTDAIVVSNITSYLPARSISSEFINRCAGFDLADPGFWKPAAIDFLVGADLFAQVMTGSVIPIDGSQASLFSSIFGYIVLGKVDGSPEETTSSLFSMTADEDLNLQLKRFWELEEPTRPQIFSNPEDELCEDHFKRTHARQPDGKYIIRLPFRENPPTVGDSSYVARKRFLNLEKKLDANPILKKCYHEVISEYLDLDHMTSASMPTKFVIPHHCVAKEENDNVKLRVVFDASVSVPKGSLNSHLLVGEKLQRDIKDVVQAYRRHRVAFSADIVKMFRMIVVDPQDRGFLQIFWRFHKTEQLQLLELKTLPFGLVSSPFIALRVLKQLCIDHREEFPQAAHVLDKDIYVDDVLTGALTEADALELKQQLVSLLQKGGFRLSKWVSNSKQILDSVDQSNVKSIVSLSDKEDTWVKLLGLLWDPSDDAFLFSLQTPNPVYTKRGILSAVARLYDPLGFLTPVTLLMKCTVQDLWKLGVHWDEVIPENIKNLWDSILSELHYLSSIRIPRFLHTAGQFECHMVGFSDASLRGYAAVIYLRVFTKDNGWQTSFLTSKSKLSPAKATSIPRLELSGALLLTELFTSNQEFFDSLPGPFQPPTFLTDSSIVLGWLNTPTFKLQTFVANRVAKIQDATLATSWRHVDSEDNPSDAASRGLLPSQLPTDELWWKGPSWLTLNQEDWPAPSFSVASELPELKPSFVSLVASRTKNNPWIPWLERHSSFLKILRTIAWVKRWIYNVKHVGCCCCPMRTGPLRLFELDLALEDCIKWTQEQHLFQGHSFDFIAQQFAKLQPFLDQRGLVRVGGRIRRASVDEAQRFPILLPTDAHLTTLLVDHYHRAYLHPGPNLLQAIIQKLYWVPSLRRLIRLQGFKCKTCYRLKAKAATPLMGDLPTYRVNGGRAFLHVGIDFGGPFQMRESLRRKAPVSKVYLCLFVCMATKALHLETVTRLSTDAFIAALDRFTSRRGLPSDLYSDRGSNFIGAANYFTELQQWFRSEKTKEDLVNYTTRQHINWHFNPPLTPHMGGIWEAGIKSVKGHLYKIVGDHILTYEEMTTLFHKIEAILNSRPLCPLSASPEETDYLSPGHFLVGGPLVAIPQASLLDLKENMLDRWQLVSALQQRFWKRWQSEYLSTLQVRPKWAQRTPNIQVGDLVLLKDTGSPLSWPTAKVVEVQPGEDGIVRVATIRTAKAEYKRPAVKLVPLLPMLSPNLDPTSSE